jgi:hypothetical protein
MPPKANRETPERNHEMLNTKNAKQQANAIKDAVVDRIDHITTNEKIAGAAVIGAAVGAAATALGSALLHAHPADKVAKAAKKPSA